MRRHSHLARALSDAAQAAKTDSEDPIMRRHTLLARALSEAAQAAANSAKSPIDDKEKDGPIQARDLSISTGSDHNDAECEEEESEVVNPAHAPPSLGAERLARRSRTSVQASLCLAALRVSETRRAGRELC